MSIDKLKKWVVGDAGSFSEHDGIRVLADHDAVVAERDAALKRVAELEAALRAPVLVQRRQLQPVLISGGRVLSSVHMLYEELYSDGSTRLRRGRLLMTVPTFEALNGSRSSKAKAMKRVRPDLRPAIVAAATLLKSLEDECLRADSHDGLVCGFFDSKGEVRP